MYTFFDRSNKYENFQDPDFINFKTLQFKISLSYTNITNKKGTKSQYNKLFDRKVNWCKFLEKPNKADVINSYLSDRFIQKNLPFKQCPAKKGIYNLKLSEIFIVSDFPMSQYFVGDNEILKRIFRFTVLFLSKEKQKMVMVSNETFFAQIKNM